MNYYLDIKIKPDAEMRENVLLNKVYTKLHKAIFDLNANDIGVSFPSVKVKLGDVVRIHSTQNKLNELQNLNWLGGLSGYCKVSDILPVPDKVDGFQTISRIRQNMSLARMRKKITHQQNKGYIKTDDDIKTYEKYYKEKMFKTGLDNPYLELQSTSTGSKYRLYIQFGDVQQQAVAGEFNRFGLSETATIPIF
ncbi:CRISPR-associated protein, Csy4 family [hydrothermal vent metagenome]|uniref:CRISPR-associated protein, Csy4 family n=1 Tax=hydrothermal vent metagenome TaxID=652676 RepID=A0A1W1BEJ5_9ZZZZ